MLILGRTSDDKGAQLEALLHATLTAEGYSSIRRNDIREGGNELDLVAERKSLMMGDSHTIQVICEAKAYADPVSTPNWQRFLGKLLLARSIEDPSTVGVFVALNGVNGNVSGSYKALRKRDSGVLIIDGERLEDRARAAAEIESEAAVSAELEHRFHQEPVTLEVAFYAGTWYWIARWSSGSYSVVGGRGELLTSDAVEELRPALESSLSGTLLTAADAQIAAEKEHHARLAIIGRLMYGLNVPYSDDTEDLVYEFGARPFCIVDGSRVVLRSPAELDAAAVGAFFATLFQNLVSVESLAFVADRLLDPWVERLIDLLPEIQGGFTLSAEDEQSLRMIAPLFPSIWLLLAQPIDMIVGHGRAGDQQSDALEVDRNSFWEKITRAVQGDFANPGLRGFLYEHMGVVELEESRAVKVKSKIGLVATLEVEVRNRIGQLEDELARETGARHMMIRVLPSVEEPWDEEHPLPTIELRRPEEVEEARP